MNREEVFNIIDDERDYQETIQRVGKSDDKKSIAEWINYIEHHLEEAKKGVYYLNDFEALHELRKVAALCVACGEYHNMPYRPPKLF